MSSNFKGKNKKTNLLDLNKYLGQEIKVKFSGGREGQYQFETIWDIVDLMICV